MARTRLARPTRRELLHGLAAVGLGSATGAAVHGYSYARHHIDVTHTRVPLAGLPAEFVGLRIGFLTDLHRSTTVPHELVEKACRLVMEETPDVILLGGDYVTLADRRFAAPAADALAGLDAPLGVHAVLGNHDDEREVPAALAAKGITVLRDARTRLTRRGASLDLAGIRYWTSRRDDIARVLKGATGTVLLLAHTPKRLYEAAAMGVSLMLSGHTHGGQIVLPGVGAIAAREFPVVAGLGHRGGTTAYVSRGIGTVYVPVRVNCPPEAALLTLDRA
jgi:uncharacterized protein